MPRPTILVVDDDDDLRGSLCDLLVEHGFEALPARHGEEALELLRARRDVRAIVLDITMPVMNGATFRGTQLADESMAAVPLIVLTGRDDIAPLAQAMKPAACLRKPFAVDELLRVLNAYR